MKSERISYLYIILLLGLLNAFGPFVIDMYLPSLPEMTHVFNCSASVIQLGLTFSMIGLAIGQLLFGPLSDKYGRKPILLITLLIFVIASVVCCYSGNVIVFTVGRLFQGIGGAGGVVLSRSIAADKYSGQDLAKTIAIISIINNMAPIAAPVAGGAIAYAWGWRAIFVTLLCLGILLFLMSLPFDESLIKKNRYNGSLLDSLKSYKFALQIPGILRYSLIYSAAMAALFAYISATPFIVQTVFGFTELQFSIVFAVNAICLGFGAGMSIKFPTSHSAIRLGTTVGVIAAFVLAICAFSLGDLFLAYEIPTGVMMFSLGLILTSSTTITMDKGRKYAGVTSAMLGGMGYITGGIISPLVSLGNIQTLSALFCLGFIIIAMVCNLTQPKVADVKIYAR